MKINKISDLLGQHHKEIQSLFKFDSDRPTIETIEDQSYVSFPRHGISLVLPDGERIETIQLHQEGHEGFSKFNGTIPGEIIFSLCRSDIHKKFGMPKQSGERKFIPILGEMPAWDCYVIDGISVHIEYTPELESIQLISLRKYKD